MRVVMNEVEFLSKWGCLTVPKPWLQEKKLQEFKKHFFCVLQKSNKKKTTLYEEVSKRV
jgi:hypothetical protein